MRFAFILSVLFLLSLSLCAGKYTPSAQHPRLHFSPSAEKRLADFLKTSKGKLFRAKILYDANELLKENAFRPQSDGRRILHFANEQVRRVHLLGMAYRISGDKKYAQRGIREILSVCKIKSWNPSHFLDTAELALAVGTCYDWFYPHLSKEEKKIMEKALLEKAFTPALQKCWWINARNNWTQVCHGGLTAAAIAIYESCPETAEKLIARAVDSQKKLLPLIYGPEGTYPEGAMYWVYGTSFTSILLSVLESAYGTDFGIGSSAGLNRTLEYFSMTLSPSGKHYAWGDGGEYIGYRTLFSIYFLSRYFHTRKNILPEFDRWFHALLVKRTPYLTDGANSSINRFIPLIALNFQSPDNSSAQSNAAYYSGDTAPVPVAMFRSKDGYFGIKGGPPNNSHGHMDTGSFVYDAAGIRWFHDPGGVNYALAERSGIDLWNMKQDSGRWSLFRLGTEAHNIIAIPGVRQNVSVRGRLTVTSPGCVTLNLDGVYPGKWTRQAQFRMKDSSLEITDTLSGFPAGTVLLFQLASRAEGSREKEGTLILRAPESGAVLTLEMNASEPSVWKITDESHPHNAAEGKRGNPNLRMFRYAQTVKKDGEPVVFHAVMRVKKGN